MFLHNLAKKKKKKDNRCESTARNLLQALVLWRCSEEVFSEGNRPVKFKPNNLSSLSLPSADIGTFPSYYLSHNVFTHFCFQKYFCESSSPLQRPAQSKTCSRRKLLKNYFLQRPGSPSEITSLLT